MDVQRRWMVVLPIVAGTCLLLTAVVIVLIVGFRSITSGGREQNEGMPFDVVEVTPTLLVPPPTETPPAECETVISSGDVQSVVPLPVLLTVGDVAFPVTPVLPDAGEWTGPGSPETAVWVCGAVVNYLVQLSATSENEELLASMEAGTPIVLSLSDGTELLFRFSGRQEVEAYAPAALGQSRPMVSLIIPKSAMTWRVATGAYVAEAEVSPERVLAEINQPVRVGDVQVTVTGAQVIREAAYLEPGKMAFLVDYTVENLSAGAIDSSAFIQVLQDSAGNEYAVSPQASASGDYGLLAGQIAPGQTAQGTAGFVVSQALPRPAVVWSFSLIANPGLQANVSIPYEPDMPTELPVAFEMIITDAFLSSDGTTLVIEGEVRNTGDVPISIELADVSLTSSAGLSDLRAAAPPLPWTMGSGQAQIIELQYTRPDAAAALLSILGYSFEIQGLR